MLIIKDNKLSLSDLFVTCNGETKAIGDEGSQWWIDTCNKHEFDYSFKDAVYEKEILDRFEKIKDFDIKYLAILEQYVLEGTEIVSDELKLELLKKDNESLKSQLLDTQMALVQLYEGGIK